MVLCDWPNDSVKLVDLVAGRLVSCRRLLSAPWDVCAIPGNKVAVTCPLDGNIQISSTLPQLRFTEYIKTRRECRGIRYWLSRLIVTFYGGSVQILDMWGNVLKEIDNKKSGYQLFETPLYLTLDINEGSALYVSDNGKSTIIKMDLSLEVVAKIENEVFKAPGAMFPLDDHHLLVCAYGSHNVVLVNTETQDVRELLGPGQGIKKPRCVSYSAVLRKLYVTYEFCDSVKVFNMLGAAMPAFCGPVRYRRKKKKYSS